MSTINYSKRQLSDFSSSEGEALISSGPRDNFDLSLLSQDNTRPTKEQLEFYSTKCALASRALMLKSNSIWGQGIKVICEDERAQKLCDEVVSILEFKEWAIENFKFALGYGTGWGEVIWDDMEDKEITIDLERKKTVTARVVADSAKKITGFGSTDPKTMDFIYDKKGNVEIYKQKVVSPIGDEENTTAYFLPDQIAMFRFNRIADDIEGIGLIEPLIPTIDAVMRMTNDIKHIIKRFSQPFVQLIKHGAKAKEIPKLKNVANKVSGSSSFAGSEKYEFKFHGAEGLALKPREYADIILDEFAGGFGIPKPVLLAAGEQANRSSLQQLAVWNRDEIGLYQSIAAGFLVREIFIPLLKRNGLGDITPEVKFLSANMAVENERFSNAKLLAETITIALKADIIEKEEATDMFRKLLDLKEQNTDKDEEVKPEEEKDEEMEATIEEMEENENER